MDGTKQGGVDLSEVMAWAAGGTVGAAVGSLMGRSGAVLGALTGAVIADQIVDSMQPAAAPAPKASAPAAHQAGGATSPGQSAGQAASALQQCKTQLVAVMNQVPDSSARTVCQMAINALNYGAVECQTVAGALSVL